MSNALPLPCQPPASTATPCLDQRGTLVATVLGSSLVFVLGSIVNVALPQMQAAFDRDAAGVQWIVNAYLLPLAALVLIGGALGDHYGRKRVFLWGMALFAASCLLCAVAWSFPVLIAGRVLEGVAAALIAPTSLAILADAFTGRARGAAIGTWAGAGAAAGALAPVAGGAVVDAAGWRWAFVAVVPFIAWGAWAAIRSVRESRAAGAERAPLDWAGAILATLGLLGLAWGLTALPDRGAGDPAAWIALAAGAAAMAAFWAVERRRDAAAMMPPALFRDRAFAGLSAFTLLLYAALGGLMLLFPYVLIRDLGYSATMAGAAILPFPLILGLLSRVSGGALTDRFGARTMLAAGAALVAGGFVGFALTPEEGVRYLAHLLPPLVVLALGMALAVAPLTSAVLAAAGDDHAGIASGVNNAISRVGGLVATALLGLVLLGDPDRLMAGFAAAAWAGAALAAISAALALVALRD